KVPRPSRRAIRTTRSDSERVRPALWVCGACFSKRAGINPPGTGQTSVIPRFGFAEPRWGATRWPWSSPSEAVALPRARHPRGRTFGDTIINAPAHGKEDAMSTVTTPTRTLPTSSQRIAPQKFAHVVLKTASYDAVIAWYATVLQARVAFRNDFIAFLTYDDEHHRVAVLNTPGSPAPDPEAAGVHHIAYTYGDLGELLGTYRRLKAAGIEPARCINHGPSTSMYYRDPDGLRVELQIDNFTMDEANAYFTSPEFAENPIGVIFDPEELIRDYEGGRPHEHLIR